MKCDEAREGLWPPERPKLLGDEVAAARAHVEECPDCTEYFDQDRELIEAYERMRRRRAPLDVRESVFDALSEARWGSIHEKTHTPDASDSTPARRRAWIPLVIAAGLAAIALGTMRGPQGWGEGPAPDDPAMFVEDYLRRAVGQDHIETSDPEEIVRFLGRELGLMLRPIQQAGLRLERAEICLLEGRRGAMIVYKKDGAAISQYLVPKAGATARPPSLSRGGSVDMPVVTWSAQEVEFALVGEVSADQLLRLAGAGTSEP